ncbi:MAG: hypothetical protein JWP00_3915 [Chloroflexi bacterium]|jgi:hypothetical protein|nr:hypothetical protein [Chloroflexota bacterium]
MGMVETPMTGSAVTLALSAFQPLQINLII